MLVPAPIIVLHIYESPSTAALGPNLASAFDGQRNKIKIKSDNWRFRVFLSLGWFTVRKLPTPLHLTRLLLALPSMFYGSGRTDLGSQPEPGPVFGFSVRTETDGRDLTTTPKPTPTLDTWNRHRMPTFYLVFSQKTIGVHRFSVSV
jgi:hypothetical protein